jgi:serine protease inhibitor
MKRLVLILTVFVLAGCDTALGPDEPTVEVRPLTAQEALIAETDRTFGLAMFRRLNEADPEKNVFFSPLSLSMALGMTLNGADGQTYENMRHTMALEGLDEEEINSAFRSLIAYLRNLDRSVDFRIANSIWYREGFSVEQAFVERTKAFFDAEVSSLDFGRPDAPDIINAWIARATAQRIERMIEQIGADVVMYLINAIYFKADWRYRFEKAATRPRPFSRLSGSSVEVPMMYRAGTFAASFSNDFVAVELPYGDSLYAMTVVMPTDKDVNTFIADLDADSWDDILNSLRPIQAELYMPKFEIAYERLLNDDLKQLGMSNTFCGDTGVSFARINPADALCVSQVRQKAVVNVDEDGTEAAAVTVVEISRVSMPPTINLNRPFFFSIREVNSGVILFMGKMVDPALSD